MAQLRIYCFQRSSWVRSTGQGCNLFIHDDIPYFFIEIVFNFSYFLYIDMNYVSVIQLEANVRCNVFYTDALDNVEGV